MVRVGAHVRRAALVGAAISAFCLSGVAAAQSIAANDYHIAAQDLGQALSALARQAGLQLVADGDLIQGKRSTAVTGHLSLEEALEQVLDRTGLTATISDNTIVIRGRSEPPRDERTHAAESSSDVVVTGSRIRGRAPAGAAVTAIDRTAIEQTGYATTQRSSRPCRRISGAARTRPPQRRHAAMPTSTRPMDPASTCADSARPRPWCCSMASAPRWRASPAYLPIFR